ncbi:amino acid ABC transporter permease [Arsenicicoccus piscis]|uniref:Glutamate ABC transporter permease n=1 Tax=Arsenicicoccus piscis TaxID=673954 RepID=A0ABQ6HVH6_9MICO|nr:amino acid ABC transporter permease [Arsenicicoccus piscis]GMA21873.1 glutamate ABC transporter permease [Arsenicicoccus piscis]
MSAGVLFDAPGPRGRAIQRVVAIVLAVLAIGLGIWILKAFADKGQLAPAMWRPMLWTDTWADYIIPGLVNTLKAAALSMVLAAVFGLVFGFGRLSEVTPVRWVSNVVVELFRSIPVLVLMLTGYAVCLFQLGIGPQASFIGTVVGLTLYNGAVVAELLRSGVENLPKGQREAGLSIGLTGPQTLRAILAPQALTAMLPAIMSQLVVVLKDTALGYAITYPELLNTANQIGGWQGNLIPAMIFIAVLYIAINFTITTLANYLETRMRRRGHNAALPPDNTPEDKQVIPHVTTTTEMGGSM